MNNKYIMFDINDEKSGKLAEVLANKTCKKILSLLAEEELSQGDISKSLNFGLNTVDYNIKKLIEVGLIEKTSNFFWSVKGKKILIYKLANKKIIISPKTSFKGMLISILGCGIISGAVKIFMNSREITSNNIPLLQSGKYLVYSAAPSAAENVQAATSSSSYFTGFPLWFIIGLILGSIGFIIYQKLKSLKLKGGLKIILNG